MNKNKFEVYGIKSLNPLAWLISMIVQGSGDTGDLFHSFFREYCDQSYKTKIDDVDNYFVHCYANFGVDAIRRYYA